MKKRSMILRFGLPFIMASIIAFAGCGSGTAGQESSGTALSSQSTASEEKVEFQESQTGSGDETSSEGSQSGSSEEKIAYDEDGLPYVANQILLYAYPGTDSQLIERLADEIGADIADFTPELQFYQLEFREDKTYSELKEYIDFFLVRQFISEADLNYYSAESQPD